MPIRKEDLKEGDRVLVYPSSDKERTMKGTVESVNFDGDYSSAIVHLDEDYKKIHPSACQNWKVRLKDNDDEHWAADMSKGWLEYVDGSQKARRNEKMEKIPGALYKGDLKVGDVVLYHCDNEGVGKVVSMSDSGTQANIDSLAGSERGWTVRLRDDDEAENKRYWGADSRSGMLKLATKEELKAIEKKNQYMVKGNLPELQLVVGCKTIKMDGKVIARATRLKNMLAAAKDDTGTEIRYEGEHLTVQDLENFIRWCKDNDVK